MRELKLIFILHQNVLYLIVQGNMTKFDLTSYAFDSNAVISSGRSGNHLFKKTGPIKDIRAIIKNRLQKMERLRFKLNLLNVSGIFISDRQLNNLAIKHYCDLLVQVNCRVVTIYYDSTLLQADIQTYITHVNEHISDQKIIGKGGPKAFSYWYDSIDNSIYDDGLLESSSRKSRKS